MQYLGAGVDVFHALTMLLWVAGFPFLFLKGYPKISKLYFIYTLLFILINQISKYFLGECVLTTIAGYFYSKSDDSYHNEWFIVRVAYSIFGLVPSHEMIRFCTKVIVVITIIGVIYFKLVDRKNVK